MTPTPTPAMRAATARRLVPLLLALLLATPVLVGAAYAGLASLGLAGAGADGAAGLARVVAVLGAGSTWRSVAWTTYVATTSTLLATIAAITIASAFPDHGPLARSARGLATLPLPVPHLVAAATALLLLGQSGLLGRVLFALGLVAAPATVPVLVYDRAGFGLIATLAWKEVPFLALVAIALRQTLGDAYDEAAASHGASAWARWRHVTWPLLWRGLMPAAIAVFAFALGSYETAVLLAPVSPAPLPVLTMERFADPALARRGEAYVLALLGLAIAAVAVAAHEWTRARWARAGAARATGVPPS